MQYKIILPDNFDMNIIRKRVEENGYKTDGFTDLLFKAYLISESNHAGSCNEYAPLYLWKTHHGMNQFIFNGFYDNILNSFGWQHINISIPMQYELSDHFQSSQYVLEKSFNIAPTQHMKPLTYSYEDPFCTGKVLTYNPDKWQYHEYYFFQTLPEKNIEDKIYQILHISM